MKKDRPLLFGERVLTERRRRGLSQTQLADIVGVSVSSIRNYENNISYPDTKKAMKIADALGVSLDFLLFRFFEHCIFSRSPSISDAKMQSPQILFISSEYSISDTSLNM